MKKLFLTFIILSIICISMTSCHKDCVCKYYRDGKLYDIKTWDDKHVTDEDCEGMNDSREVSIFSPSGSSSAMIPEKASTGHKGKYPAFTSSLQYFLAWSSASTRFLLQAAVTYALGIVLLISSS